MILKYSKKQWLILFVYSVINILSGFCGSLQGPFYPMIAESKRATPSQFGFVFGAYSLALFIVSPLSGAMINKFGVSKVNLSGILIVGVTSILFGFVDKINGTVLFISVSVAIRLFEGLGYAMTRNAGIAIVSFEFPENIETSFAIVQSFSTFGYLIGPVVGGALYELGGFYLPFVFVGILHLCISFVVIILPKDYQKQEQSFSMEIVKLLCQPLIVLGILSVFGVFFNFLFIGTVLEPHLKSLNFSPFQVGIVFMSQPLAYSIGSYFWSLLCEKYDNPLFIIVFSSIIAICGYLLLGPAPYLSFEFNIYSCVFGLFILGIGFAGNNIGGFSLLNKGADISGLPKNIQTSGFISTIYVSSFAIGPFIGPLLGGYVFETFGFPWGSHLFILYQLILGIGLIIFPYFWSDKFNLNGNTKLQPLSEETVNYRSIGG